MTAAAESDEVEAAAADEFRARLRDADFGDLHEQLTRRADPAALERDVAAFAGDAELAERIERGARLAPIERRARGPHHSAVAGP